MGRLYHDKDTKQCYYECHCLVCFIQLFFINIRRWAKQNAVPVVDTKKLLEFQKYPPITTLEELELVLAVN